jgi:hypothetical protein
MNNTIFKLILQIFNIKNITKIIIIFTIGFISRALINNLYNTNNSLDYLNIISIIYSLYFSMLVFYFNEIIYYYNINIIYLFDYIKSNFFKVNITKYLNKKDLNYFFIKNLIKEIISREHENKILMTQNSNSSNNIDKDINKFDKYLSNKGNENSKHSHNSGKHSSHSKKNSSSTSFSNDSLSKNSSDNSRHSSSTKSIGSKSISSSYHVISPAK